MSNNLTDEEYLDLVVKLADQQYDNSDHLPEQVEWTYSEPLVKEKMLRSKNDAIIDFSKFKKDKIKELLFVNTNIKVFDFLIRITLFHGTPDKNGAYFSLDATLYQEVHKTPLSGVPCNMTIPFDPYRDKRFATRSWLKNFTGCHGKNIPQENLIDIILFLQAIKNIPAFF